MSRELFWAGPRRLLFHEKATPKNQMKKKREGRGGGIQNTKKESLSAYLAFFVWYLFPVSRSQKWREREEGDPPNRGNATDFSGHEFANHFVFDPNQKEE